MNSMDLPGAGCNCHPACGECTLKDSAPAQPHLDNVTRLEVVGPGGTEFEGYFDKGVTAITYDDGKTLRIYVGEYANPFSRESFLEGLTLPTIEEMLDCIKGRQNPDVS